MSTKRTDRIKSQPNSRPLNWRNTKKQIPRVFKLVMDVPLYSGLVEEVLDTIENDTLRVFRPDDQQALHQETNVAGEILVNKRATLPVSIREWLPVGCQLITRYGSPEPHTLAYYQHNGPETIFPVTGEEPPGPAAFCGRICLLDAVFLDEETENANDALRFVVAHELVHVFDAMRFVVPAVMDWPSFWGNVLNQGTQCNLLHSCLEHKSLFLDSYATENELAMVKEIWPSRADKWFVACNAIYRRNKTPKKRG